MAGAPTSSTNQSNQLFSFSKRKDWIWFGVVDGGARYIGPSSSRLTNQQSIDFTNSIHKFIPLFNQIDCCLRYHRGSWCQYNNYCYNILFNPPPTKQFMNCFELRRAFQRSFPFSFFGEGQLVNEMNCLLPPPLNCFHQFTLRSKQLWLNCPTNSSHSLNSLH